MASDITPEAIGFLSAVGVFIVALAILFLFINKKLCFSRVGGLPCLEEHGRHKRGRQGVLQGLVGSYGYDNEAASSSSGSEDEVLKQFEISLSRSQSFRAAPSSSGPDLSHQAPTFAGQRHKFSRLSEEEGSSGPSDCEADTRGSSRPTFRDPLGAVEERSDRMSALRPDAPAVLQGSDAQKDPVLSANRPAADGSEGPDIQDQDQNEVTDSSSTWSPEPEQTLHGAASSQPPSSPSSLLVSKCGELLLSLEYRPGLERLLVCVLSARNVPDKARSGTDAWQVRMLLLPPRKQRHKTSVQRGAAPHFNETFRFSNLEPSGLHTSAIRFRLYALGGRMSRERMIGEKELCLEGMDPQGGKMETTLALEPRGNLKTVGAQTGSSAVLQSDSASSLQSLTRRGAPELQLGLSYNATTGRMSVELIKGSHFRNMTQSRPPDTYGRLTLLNSVGQEIARCKTSVRRGQPNPVYKETFVFQVALFQLSDVTLLVSVYNRRSMKRKEMVGWMALGQNSSGEEELLHWQDMRESKGQQVCRWHVLLEA